MRGIRAVLTTFGMDRVVSTAEEIEVVLKVVLPRFEEMFAKVFRNRWNFTLNVTDGLAESTSWFAIRVDWDYV